MFQYINYFFKAYFKFSKFAFFAINYIYKTKYFYNINQILKFIY